MSRAVRKLVKAGDVEGLLAEVAEAEGEDRAAALEGILACMETHADRVKETRAAVLAVCVPLVRDPHQQIRALSLGIVIALRDPSAPSLAVAALSDPAPGVRVSGLLGVFHLQPPGSLGHVIRLLDDEDENVRSFAAATIERVGDASSVTFLEEARAHEPEQRVRERIDEVVDILEGRKPPTPIESSLETG